MENNNLDHVYGNNCFLKSYIVNGKVRVFVGRLTGPNGSVKEIGYDVNKREYISLPIDSNGLLDDNSIMDYLKDDDIGFDKEIYQNSRTINLVLFLMDFNIDPYEVIHNLFEFNMIKTFMKKDKNGQ